MPVKKDGLLKRISFSGKLKRISSVADDLLVLKSIWFNKASGDDHAERLESFYGPQAAACAQALQFDAKYCSEAANVSAPSDPACAWCADDNFRSKFLWGRKPMLAACAARLAEKNDLVWVDLGGGTGVSRSCRPQYAPHLPFARAWSVRNSLGVGPSTTMAFDA